MGNVQEPFDFVEFAQSTEGQTIRAEMVEARLQRAVDALIHCRLVGCEQDHAALRDLLFDLYEADILTRDQVREREQLDPAVFYEELHEYRLRNARR